MTNFCLGRKAELRPVSGNVTQKWVPTKTLISHQMTDTQPMDMGLCPAGSQKSFIQPAAVFFWDWEGVAAWESPVGSDTVTVFFPVQFFFQKKKCYAFSWNFLVVVF